MSPAIVDFRTPVAASPQVPARRSPPSPNPGKGQILASPPPFSFDPTGISPTHRPSAATSARSMDRVNKGHSFLDSGNSTNGGVNGGFVSPGPSLPPSSVPSVSAAGKPSPAAGLSKPRLVKVRKHFASPRVRSTVDPQVGDALGFNPFRTEPAVSAARDADQKEGGGMRGLNEKLYSRQSFSEPGITVPDNSSAPNLSSFESENSESSGFVFGAGSALKQGENIGSENVKDCEFSFGSKGSRGPNAGLPVFGSGVTKSSDSERCLLENLSSTKLGSFESAKSENPSFVLGAGSGLKPSVDIVSETVKDHAFNFGSEGSRGSNAGLFAFGSGVKKISELGQSSQENLSGTNMGSFESVKSEISGFVFGAGSASYQSAKTIGSGNSIDCAYSFGSEGSGSSETSVFVFGSSVKKSSDSERNSPETSSGLNLGNFESVKSESVDFVFGASSVSNLNKPNHTFNFAGKESSNYHSGAFVPGSGVEKNSNLSQKSSGNSTDSNMGHFKTENSENTAFVFSASAGSFSDSNSVGPGASVDAAPGFMKMVNGKPDLSVFVHGSGTQKGASSSWNLPGNSSIPNLGTYESLKPENANFNFGASSTSSLRSKSMGSGKTLGGEFSFTSDRGWNPDTGVFVFGSGMGKSSNLGQSSSIGSEEGPFLRLPNEMRKLNLQSSGNEEGFEKTKQDDNKAKVDESNAFVFGCNQDASSSTDRVVNPLPEEMRNLNIGNETVSKNTKIKSMVQTANVFVSGSDKKKSSASSQRSTNPVTSFEKSACSELPNGVQKLNIEGSRNDGFTFPSNKDAPDSCEGNGVHTPYNDMQKLNINRPENSTVNIDQGDLSAAGVSASFKFTFQVGKQDANSTSDHVPPSKAEEHFKFCRVATPSFNLSSSGPVFRFVGTQFTFTSMHAGQETPCMEIKTHKQDDSRLSKENLFTGPHHVMSFNMKKGEVKSTRTKKRRGKSRLSIRASHTFAKPFISTGHGSFENVEPESPGDYSPMDYSPYQENLVADQTTREASVASDESRRIFSGCESTDTQRSFSVDEREGDLVSATQGQDINEDDLKKHDSDGSKSHVERNFAAKSSTIDEQNSGPGRESFLFKSESVGLSRDNTNAAMKAETGPFSSPIERQATEGGTSFTFATSSEDFGGSDFTFAASPFPQGPLSAAKRHYRRKYRMKTGQDLYNSTPNASVPFTSTNVQPDSAKDLEGMPSICQFADDKKAETNRKPESNNEDITKDAASAAAQEACEKWRVRGNQAYANGYLSKAEQYYTRGVNSLSPNETSRNCSRASMLCYSNRAAARMSLGRMREALNDCMMAVAIDPSFLRAQVRAANCHLALGEIEDALKHFKKCLKSDDGARWDQKILAEASEGLQKAQQVADYIVQFEALLLKRTPDEVTKALQLISEAMLISPYSEYLMEMKAEALLMRHSYGEVIQFCEQSLDSAERISFLAGSDDQLNNVDSSGNMKSFSVRLWRWRVISKSYFYLGKLEDALELLRKHEQVKPIVDRYGNKSSENSTSLSVTIRKLLRLKAAGNEAFRTGRHLEALEHYTAALACNTESHPFAAVCFCNRAAAYQALGQIADAIADCSLAIALDATYSKAISRRATLHEMIRDYGHATNDLCRLISLLEMQLTKNGNRSGSLGKSTSNDNDLNQARLRLSSLEEEARRETPLDMYMILGIEPSSSEADVKKAYRKAALRHHPDKAGQFLARSENADDGLWREVADEVYRDADQLFKMIGEAYTVLSDPAKRLQYDAEEEIRTMKKKGYNKSSTPKTSADKYSSRYEKSSNRRQWQSYRTSHQRW